MRDGFQETSGISRVVNSVMTSTATRTDLAEFLKNPENARGVNGLVEDIHYARTDYQVHDPKTTCSYHT